MSESADKGKPRNSGPVFPLAMAGRGDLVKVVRIQGGAKFAYRLKEMGLGAGDMLRVVSSGFGGPLIVEIGGSRLAIGRGMALKIYVALDER